MVDADHPHVGTTSEQRDKGAIEKPASDSPGTAPDRLTRRSIRSFVVRNGRQTAAQSEALATLLPRYGIPYQSGTIDLVREFDRDAPCWVEIGFGNGDSLLHIASEHPDINVIGIEVHAPGVGHALLGIEQRALSNVRLIHHDAVEVLQDMILPGSLNRVLLLFPDPWHKKRHHKRRIVQKEFLDAVARGLQSEGILHCATDWEDYAHWMTQYLDDHEAFANTTRGHAERPAYRIASRFERRGERLGHDVFDLLYQKR